MFQSIKYAAATLVLFAGIAQADVGLKGEGATFPQPLYNVWAEKFDAMNTNITIDYQGSGSGGGIKAITNKTVDFAGSDVKLNKEELSKAGDVVYIPTCAGAVVAAYNLPGFNGELKLDGEVLANIYLGKITQWNDAKIAELNPGANLPSLAITPVYRADGSGTNAVFTKYLASQNPEFKDKIGAGKSVQWPIGQGAPSNAGVTKVVKDIKGALGYIELNYALANNVSMASMKNKAGKFVTPSLDSVSAAAASAETIPADILNQPGDKAYPIASFTYILVHKDLSYIGDKAKVEALLKFLNWAETDGQKLASANAYAPLPEPVVKKVMENLNSLTFNGAPAK